jgi:hypothetical protein
VSASDPDNDEISSEAEYISARRATAPAGKYPIMFPPPNSQISLNVYEGGEWPEPLAAFPDYRLPSGLPITLELGPDAQTNPITDHQLIADGRSIEHQIFDATSYAGASPDQTGDGRAILESLRRNCAGPQAPLAVQGELRCIGHRRRQTISLVVHDLSSRIADSDLALIDNLD